MATFPVLIHQTWFCLDGGQLTDESDMLYTVFEPVLSPGR